jgi:hypothetical protein
VTADDFAISVERLLNQVGHWEQSRWWAPARARSSVPAGSPIAASSARAKTGRGTRRVPAASRPTKGDSLYALVQHLADLAADAEGNPHRPVSRPGDLALPDQFRVMSDDLIAAAPSDEALRLATDDINATRDTL